MSRLNPEVFSLYRRRAEALRRAAIRAWNPLSWLATRCRDVANYVARHATRKTLQG